ncbi:uncharacterized protein EV422DRAFT_235447 [Fimicolochytrium jonesii]|uniref:uncharacterized protein n=1 Tax=Fimicolochytrium jonesii TaxID=1396493 RepID=UPI0022FEC801|nr:uncharacterized protein EV422DRAFT_235447 [Fimicolochytrium jonesii]KAI8824849.1 hypothetical protein EV422DRAFT_235447 [Fimicolochytrium jonesii]
MNRVGISTSTPRYEDDDDAEHYFRNPDVIYGVHDTISTSDPESPPSSPEPTDFSYSSIARSNVLIPDGVEAFYPSKHHEGDAQPEEREPLCPFAMQGRCRYGEHCRYRHGDACPVCGKMCLDPLDGVEVHQEHIKQCEQEQHNRVDLAAAASASEEMDCVVCMETVLQKPDPRFGLLDCEHCVCLDCIRKWRTNERMDTAKSCPICRTTTHVVTPSTTWPLTPHHKQSIIQTYKSRLNTIDCKHYAHGTGTCPFGTSCLYRHVGVDGVEEKVRLRRVVGAGGEEQGEEVRILGGVMLVDFLERWEGRR